MLNQLTMSNEPSSNIEYVIKTFDYDKDLAAEMKISMPTITAKNPNCVLQTRLEIKEKDTWYSRKEVDSDPYNSWTNVFKPWESD